MEDKDRYITDINNIKTIYTANENIENKDDRGKQATRTAKIFH